MKCHKNNSSQFNQGFLRVLERVSRITIHMNLPSLEELCGTWNRYLTHISTSSVTIRSSRRYQISFLLYQITIVTVMAVNRNAEIAIH